MTDLLLAGTLTAADAGARSLTYRLLPYGEAGRTSLGTIRCARGVVTLPDPAGVVLNMEHDPTRPVARATSFTDTSDALLATFTVAGTRPGDDLLAEVAEGLRTGISVELSDVTIRGGNLTAATLTGAGAVVAPAFATARAQLVASDTADPRDPVPADDPPADAPAVDPAPTKRRHTAPDAPAPETATEEGDDVMTDTTAAVLTASLPGSLSAITTPAADVPLSTVNRMFAAVAAGDRSPQLLAALSDVTQSGNDAVKPPAWIGEIWKGNDYQRSIVPLMSQAPLTALKVTGWEWLVHPVGAPYAGDKAAVSSNAATTQSVDVTASRWAGAHDIDRSLIDFGNETFWSSYWAAMVASYSTWSDGIAAAALLAGATVVAPAATGVVSAIASGALAVMPYGRPTFVLLGSAAFGALVERDPLAFLSGTVSLADGSGNVGGLSYTASSKLAPGQVIVGVRNAVTFYELGGGSPIRVDALNIANGGVDVGAFGYAAVHVNAPLAIASVTVGA